MGRREELSHRGELGRDRRCHREEESRGQRSRGHRGQQEEMQGDHLPREEMMG